MARSTKEDGPHPVDLHVGRRVAERRIGRGFTQSDLARALSLTFQQVQKYEKGLNRMSASKLWDAAQYLGVEIDWFFDGLSTDAAGPDADGVAAPNLPTRQSVEIARLSRRLPLIQQKLVLDVMASLARSDA